MSTAISQCEDRGLVTLYSRNIRFVSRLPKVWVWSPLSVFSSSVINCETDLFSFFLPPSLCLSGPFWIGSNSRVSVTDWVSVHVTDWTGSGLRSLEYDAIYEWMIYRWTVEFMGQIQWFITSLTLSLGSLLCPISCRWLWWWMVGAQGMRRSSNALERRSRLLRSSSLFQTFFRSCQY